jgi:hypothetical protein
MTVIRHMAKRYMLYPPRQSMTITLPVLSPRFMMREAVSGHSLAHVSCPIGSGVRPS